MSVPGGASTGEVTRFDAAILSSGRNADVSPNGVVAWDESDPSAHAALVLTGTATLTVRTPFGPHEVYSIPAPAVVGLSELMIGAPRLGRLEVKGPGAIVRIPAEDAQRLVLEDSLQGAALRRMVLLSLVRSIRSANDGLKKFFDGGRPPDGLQLKKAGTSSNVKEAKPADQNRVRDLFEMVGLDPATLPELGLLERVYSGGSRLAEAGTQGEEAFLIQEGRVRVSVEIPGAGEEALAILGTGEIIGEMALVDDSPRSADLTAHEGPVSVFVLTRAVFRRLLDEGVRGSAPLLAGITVAMSRRLEETIARSASFYVLAGGPGHTEGSGFFPDEDYDTSEEITGPVDADEIQKALDDHLKE